MTTLFEDRTTYAPASDSVAVIALVVECNPGQAAAVQDFLAEVRDQAGVYSVDVEVDVKIPASEPELAVETFREEPAVPLELAAQGEANAEQLLQPPDSGHQGTEIVAGEEAAPSGEAGSLDAGADSIVAEPAGEGRSGEVERSA